MATPPAHLFSVSWQDLHRDAQALDRRLADLKFTGIVGIARGGLVPAAIVARELSLRKVDTVCVASYEGKVQGQAQSLKAIEGDGEDLLVVDDLVDTGVTARLVRRLLPRAHLATVYAKPADRSYVDTFVTMVSQDTWIVFPWDQGGRSPRSDSGP